MNEVLYTKKALSFEGGDSFPPTLYFITEFTMETREGGDSKHVLATFQSAGQKSCAKWLCPVSKGLAQSPGRRPGRQTLLSVEFRQSLTKRPNALSWECAKLRKKVERHRNRDRLLTSPYWLNIRMSWSVMLKMFLQSKFGMPASLSRSGPL